MMGSWRSRRDSVGGHGAVPHLTVQVNATNQRDERIIIVGIEDKICNGFFLGLLNLGLDSRQVGCLTT